MMQHSETIANLGAALVAAQGEFPNVAKSSTNPHFKSKFASLDAIVDAVRPVLAKHGLGVLQGASSCEDGKALLVESRLVHKSGEWITGEVVIPIAKNDPQGAGSALTYGRRYGLAALLCLATEDDDDGNAASRPQQRSSNQRSGEQRVRPTPAMPLTNGANAETAKVASGEIPDEERTFRGKHLREYANGELSKFIKEAEKAGNRQDFIKSCRNVLNARALGTDVDSQVDRMKRGVEEEEAALPF